MTDLARLRAQPLLVERTFARGPQQWRVDAQGRWSTWMWGWWPDGNGSPSGRFMPIETKDVPRELIEAAHR
jgi:hypothetical protein